MQFEWQRGDDTIRIDDRTHAPPGPVKQVLEWPGRPLLAVLLMPSAGRDGLLLLRPDGQTQARIAPPAGYELYYLALDSSLGVVVICGTDPPAKDWPDWRFAIDIERGKLERIGPSK